MDTNIYEESAQRAWDAILGKVKELEASGMKRAEISRLLGHTGRSAVTNWLKESSTSRNASFPDMLRYIDVLGLDIQDYLPKSATIRRPAPNAAVERADADGSVAIHVYALAGAGPAFDLEENDPLATIRVPLEYAMQCDSALLVKGEYRRDMDEQEFLDRMDEYNIVCVLGEGMRWVSMSINIHSWKMVWQNTGI